MKDYLDTLIETILDDNTTKPFIKPIINENTILLQIKQDIDKKGIINIPQKEMAKLEGISNMENANIKTEFKPGVGVDVGTSNIVVSRQTIDGKIINKFHRNMLFPLEDSDEAQDLLERSEYLYVKVGSTYYIVGDDALKLVNAIGKGEIIRPMKDGILNATLKESSELLFYIIKAIVGDPIVPNENLRFSIPANPIDRDLDNKFHQMTMQRFFTSIGYNAKPVNEAMCIAYDCNPITKSDEGDINLSGVVVSCGAGMWNIALCYKGLGLVEFSCTKSGDFLDEQVSKVTGIAKGKVTKIKEKVLNLDNVDENDRVQSALSIYYDEMIERMMHHISNQFKEKSSEIDGSTEMVIAGGTSMVPGFISRLNNALTKYALPLKIYRVRHSETPFYSVAQGACIRAQADYQKSQKV